MRGARPHLQVIEGEAGNGSSEEPFSNAAHVQHLDRPDSAKPANLPVLPPPPDTLPAEMHPEWSAIIAALQARRRYKDSMLGIIADYLIARWTIRAAQKAIAEHGAFVTGAGGAMKPNPATGLLCRSQDTAARLAAELGLTPTARARKSLQPDTQLPLKLDEWDL